jgi:hypothetical protein
MLGVMILRASGVDFFHPTILYAPQRHDHHSVQNAYLSKLFNTAASHARKILQSSKPVQRLRRSKPTKKLQSAPHGASFIR